MTRQKIPYLARGSLDGLKAALEEGGVFYNLDRAIYCYINSGEKEGTMAFVDPEKNIHVLVGDNPKYVQRLGELPSPDVADENILYVVNNTVYSFHDGEFYPTYEDVINQIIDLDTKVDNLVTDYEQFKTDVTDEITTFKTDVDNEITSFKTEVEGEMTSLRTDLEGEMASYKTEVDGELDTFNTAIVDLDGRVTTLQSDVASIRTGMSSLDRSVTALGRQVQGKADKATTLSGYGITDAYTKSETKALIGDTGGKTVDQYIQDTVSDAMGLIEV